MVDFIAALKRLTESPSGAARERVGQYTVTREGETLYATHAVKDLSFDLTLVAGEEAGETQSRFNREAGEKFLRWVRAFSDREKRAGEGEGMV